MPPGQYVTEKWPVLTYGPVPQVDLKAWQLRVSGEVEAEKSFSWREFQALPRVEVTADFHCVTRFSTLDNRWGGVATREILSRVAVRPGRHPRDASTATAATPPTSRSRTSWRPRRCWSTPGTGSRWRSTTAARCALIVPHLYAWKSAKWVTGIELLPEDRRGFWEENGYHTYGDPWREQRFSSQETREAHQVRRRAKELGIVPRG